MILNIRGTNGSGKTTIARRLIDEHRTETVRPLNLYTSRDRKPAIHVLRGGLYVVGRYQIGADSIPHDLLCQMVEHLSKLGHVIYENVLVSGSARRWAELAGRCEGQTTFALLDTPIEVCLARVQERNKGKKVDEGLIAYQHKRATKTTAQLAEEFGQQTVLVDHTQAYDQTCELLRAGGWDPDAPG